MIIIRNWARKLIDFCAHRQSLFINSFPLLPLLAIPVSVVAYRGLVPFGVLAALIGFTLEYRRIWSLRSKAHALWPFLALLGLGLASAAWSIDQELSLRRWLKLSGCLVFGSAVLMTMFRMRPSAAARSAAVRVLLWGGAVSLAMMLAQSVSGGSFLVALGLKAPHADPQILMAATNPAASVVAVFAAPGALLIYRRYGAAAAIVGLALTAWVIIFHSQSLAAKVGFVSAVATGVLVLLGGRATIRWLALAAIILLLLLPSARVFHPEPFSAFRSAPAEFGLSLPASAVHRTYIYDFVLERIAERPILGWGLATSRALPGGHDSISDPDPGFAAQQVLPLHPHNGILQVWVELGIFGAIALSAIIWLVLRSIAANATDRTAASGWGAAATGYYVIGIFAYDIWAEWWLTAAIFASAMAIATPYAALVSTSAGRDLSPECGGP